jgi:hypothetical protein
MSNSMKEILEMLDRYEKLKELKIKLTEQLIKQKMLDEKDNQKNMLSHESILEQLIHICSFITSSEELERNKAFMMLGSLTTKIKADLHYAENEDEDEE